MGYEVNTVPSNENFSSSFSAIAGLCWCLSELLSFFLWYLDRI